MKSSLNPGFRYFRKYHPIYCLTILAALLFFQDSALAQTLPIRGVTQKGVQAELVKDIDGRIRELNIYQDGKLVTEHILDNVTGNTVVEKILNAVQDELGGLLDSAQLLSLAQSTAANLLQSEINLDGNNITVGIFTIHPRIPYYNNDNEYKIYRERDSAGKVVRAPNLKRLRVTSIDMEVRDGYIRTLIVSGKYQFQKTPEQEKAREEEIRKKLLEENKYSQSVQSYILKKTNPPDESMEAYVREIEDSIYSAARDSADAVFQNIYGIGFSCRSNFKLLNQIRLYDNVNGESIIVAGELFTYRPCAEIDRLDYSPSNTLIRWRADDNPEMKVYKDKSINLFDLKVFTDLKGISAEAANGLVQVEFAKKIPLWTHRVQVQRTGMGAFQYLTPYFTLNKLENKVKVLPVTIDAKKQFVTVTDAFLHRQISAGIALNIISWEVQTAKTEFHLDWLTEVATLKVLVDLSNTLPDPAGVLPGLLNDSIAGSRSVNLISYGPKVTAEIFPDTRYGLKLSYQCLSVGIPNRLAEVNAGVLLSSDRQAPPAGNYREWLHGFIMEGNFFGKNKTKLFARVSYNFAPNHAASNFSQFQVGVRKELMSYITERK